MPRTTDVKSLLRFNGTVQYLAKFLPGLLEIPHPLRQLTVQNAEWIWSDSQEKAWNDIKTPITQAPVLLYFSSKSGHGRLREVVAYKRFQIL